MPPPMPNRPARQPTSAPSATKATISAESTPSWLALGELRDERPFGRIDRRDREPVAALQYAHPCELRMSAQLGQPDEPRLLDELHIDVDPARRIPRRLGIVVRILLVELRRIGIGEDRRRDDARDPRLRAARVVEERAVAKAHLVAHEVARLVVAHSEP